MASLLADCLPVFMIGKIQARGYPGMTAISMAPASRHAADEALFDSQPQLLRQPKSRPSAQPFSSHAERYVGLQSFGPRPGKKPFPREAFFG
jgi:hypothetical protein